MRDERVEDCPVCEGPKTVHLRYGKGRCKRCPSEFVLLGDELVATARATEKMGYGRTGRRLPAAIHRLRQAGRS